MVVPWKYWIATSKVEQVEKENEGERREEEEELEKAWGIVEEPNESFFSRTWHFLFVFV